MEERRTAGRRPESGPGIFLGKVVNHLDTGFLGTIEVEILHRNNAGGTGRDYVQCRYASPFFGQTPFSGVTENDSYANTQKSYGFWAVPPDIGTQVIVVMPEGNFANAYWIGCVPEVGMNFMTPGVSSTTYNSSDSGTALPVGEYNKRTQDNAQTAVTRLVKPANDEAITRLEQQGLKEDHIRGTNTSSARREAPSMVFGWSTPGPADRNGPTHRYGKPGAEVNAPFNRLGGSSFVMDDGDPSLLRKKPAAGDDPGPLDYANVDAGETDGDVTLPANDLVRIRTRTGHQILLHNTEDLIYISHGSGNSWIEMTGNGKIDVYAKDSISVRSENDINFYADRDINFEAKRNVNITTGENFFVHTIGNWEIKADTDGKLKADGNTNIYAGGDHRETTDGKIYMNSSASADQAGVASVPVRVPHHEPWPDHEHLDPTNFVPEETEAKPYDDPENEEARQGLLLNGTTDELPEPPFPAIPDTFRNGR